MTVIPLTLDDILALKFLKDENKFYSREGSKYAKEIEANKITYDYIVGEIKKSAI